MVVITSAMATVPGVEGTTIATDAWALEVEATSKVPGLDAWGQRQAPVL